MKYSVYFFVLLSFFSLHSMDISIALPEDLLKAFSKDFVELNKARNLIKQGKQKAAIDIFEHLALFKKDIPSRLELFLHYAQQKESNPVKKRSLENKQKIATKWLLEAVDKCYPPAQYVYGMILIEKKRTEEGFYYLAAAANGGTLKHIYQDGNERFTVYYHLPAVHYLTTYYLSHWKNYSLQLGLCWHDFENKLKFELARRAYFSSQNK